MNRSKRSALGSIVNLLAIAAALIGLAFYLINTNTTYFSNLGRSTPVLVSVGAAILLSLIWCIAGKSVTTFLDLFPIASPALLIFAFLTLLNSRVNGIAAVMTFENNEQNMADLRSALIALGAMAIAAVLACLASFFSVRKSETSENSAAA